RYEYIINFINDKHLLSHILENNNNEHIQEFVKDKLDILSNQDKKSGSQEFITRKFKDDRLKERYESCFIHDDFNMDDFKNKAEIFLINPNMHIRKNAVYNIKNQQLLKHIVLNDPEKSIRLAAVNRIVDENIIKDIYTRSEYDLAIRNICLKKISDDEYIRDILIKTPQYIDIVLDELDDEDIITDLLLNNWNKEFYPYIGKLVAKIHNLTNLVKLASFANYWKVRRIAIIQFEKEYDMLENKGTNYFRTIKLSDLTYYYIITHGKYLDVKIRAINKITDKFVLLRISFIAETFIERSTALRKLRR
ncbi:MAG: hypothetical protein J6S29_06535, partial [Methanosphaera sp.]|nr:hypothetical protein [Methanosphaera sp.]